MYGVKVIEKAREGKEKWDWWTLTTGEVFWTEYVQVAMAQAESVEQVWNQYTGETIITRVCSLPEPKG